MKDTGVAFLAAYQKVDYREIDYQKPDNLFLDKQTWR